MHSFLTSWWQHHEFTNIMGLSKGVQKHLMMCGSCMPQVEFEFSTWVPPKATAGHQSGGGWPSFFCLCIQMSGRKKSHCSNDNWQWLPPPIAILTVDLIWGGSQLTLMCFLGVPLNSYWVPPKLHWDASQPILMCLPTYCNCAVIYSQIFGHLIVSC